MKYLVQLLLAALLFGCAVDFNKKKKIETETFIGEAIYKQDGKMINKLQVFDQIAKTEQEEKELLSLKQDYVLAASGAAGGGLLIGLGIFNNSGANMLLMGGILAGVGYYFAMKTDQRMEPYIKKHNSRSASVFPHFYITPGVKETPLGVGFNYSF